VELLGGVIMSIRDWPKNERPREKLIERGAQVLSEAELLAVLLGSGVRGRSAVELCRQLLMEFGSLRALFSCERSRFLSHRGLGPTRYCVIQAALELGRRHFREAMCIGSVLTAPEATRSFLMTLRDRAYEVFCCLYLDNRHRLICFEELFRGTIDGASVHPREVVKQALSHNAAALIFAHKHPLC
jgi:DNA repair protein RadC